MAVPSAFRWPDARETGSHARVRARVKRMTGFDLFPAESVAAEYAHMLDAGDPIAERFVDETFLGPLGPQRSREMLDAALAGSVDDVADAPESMKALFAEFEKVPHWVDQELVEQGAAVWRRWGYTLDALEQRLTNRPGAPSQMQSQIAPEPQPEPVDGPAIVLRAA